MTNPHNQAARRPFAKSLLALSALAFCIVSLADDASAQGVVRRLGARIRETVQQRGSLLQPPAVPSVPPAAAAPAPATRTPATRSPAPASRSSNYNPAQTRPDADRNPAARRPATASTLPAAPAPPARKSPAVSAAKPPITSVRGAVAPAVAPRARLGLIVETPPPTQVPGGTFRPTRGALVVGTEPGSGSEAAGIMPGDLVVAIDGRTVIGVDELVARLGDLNPGDPVELKFVRNQKLGAVTALMAGPDGKLSKEDHATLMALVASDLESGTPSADDEPTSSPSVIGGLGRALGGWFAGGGKAPAADAQGKPSADGNTFDPLSKQSMEPLEGGVMQIDYEALRTKTDDESLDQPAAALTTDPPSLDQPIADESTELLPPPAVADPFAEPTEFLPADDNADGTATEPKDSLEQSTIQSLLKELGLLRRRIEQLEAEKANPPKS